MAERDAESTEEEIKAAPFVAYEKLIDFLTRYVAQLFTKETVGKAWGWGTKSRPKLYAISTLLVASLGTIYTLLGYYDTKKGEQPKPHLDLVFENRTEQLPIYGDDVGNGERDIKFNLVLRNQGLATASGVVVHLFIDGVLYNSSITDPNSRVTFNPINGLPPSYEAVIPWGNLAPNIPEQIGPIEFLSSRKIVHHNNGSGLLRQRNQGHW